MFQLDLIDLTGCIATDSAQIVQAATINAKTNSSEFRLYPK